MRDIRTSARTAGSALIVCGFFVLVAAGLQAQEPPTESEAARPVFRVAGDPPCALGFKLIKVEPGWHVHYNDRIAKWVSEADLRASLRDPATGEPLSDPAIEMIKTTMEPMNLLHCEWHPIAVPPPPGSGDDADSPTPTRL